MIRQKFTLICVLLLGCSEDTRYKSLDDPSFGPYRSVLEIDRDGLGFTPISADAKVRIQKNREGVFLYVDDKMSKRTIGLKKTDRGYQWYATAQDFRTAEESG